MTVFYRLPSRPRPRPMTSRLRTTILASMASNGERTSTFCWKWECVTQVRISSTLLAL